MAFPLIPLLTAGASIASTLIGARSSAQAQDRANQQSVEQSREDREFQERMSSTAHQREVTDLRAAGLNPILSANHGASTPGGSTPPIHSIAPNRAELAMNAARGLADIQVAQAQKKSLESQAVLNAATAAKTVEQTGRESLTNTISKGITNLFAWSGKAAGNISSGAKWNAGINFAEPEKG
ncbi:MAG: DNA pilot protein [Arizlama microvirus]|nr:MAG: DNA pilot protein [Arizlama microvirus]